MPRRTGRDRRSSWLTFLRAINGVHRLGISEERLEEILANVGPNLQLYDIMDSVELDKEDDPNSYLVAMAEAGEAPE